MNKVLFTLVAFATLLPFCSSGMALLLGMGFALMLGNPFASDTKKISSHLLQFSIGGLGAGMDLGVIGRVGLQGVVYTVVGISLTIFVGLALGRAMRCSRGTSLLISVGTAICGGSAIAAAASAIRAKDHEVSVSLATIFFLNALALFLFPWIGHLASLSEIQFGYWSALAIHDTSSVVGAALQYGPTALELATTVKLARALWIMPVTFLIVVFWRQQPGSESSGKIKIPWFILGFILSAALVTAFPDLRAVGASIATAAKRALVLTLFLIGSGLSRQTLKAVGFRPLAQGILLWILVAGATFGAVAVGYIR